MAAVGVDVGLAAGTASSSSLSASSSAFSSVVVKVGAGSAAPFDDGDFNGPPVVEMADPRFAIAAAAAAAIDANDADCAFEDDGLVGDVADDGDIGVADGGDGVGCFSSGGRPIASRANCVATSAAFLCCWVISSTHLSQTRCGSRISADLADLMIIRLREQARGGKKNEETTNRK